MTARACYSKCIIAFYSGVGAKWCVFHKGFQVGGYIIVCAGLNATSMFKEKFRIEFQTVEIKIKVVVVVVGAGVHSIGNNFGRSFTFRQG